MQKGKELTPKRKAFADEYLTDLNGTRAYKAVYKNVKMMRQQQQQLRDC